MRHAGSVLLAMLASASLAAHAAEPLYDGMQRTSVYVPAADGTRLAVDVYRPSRQGLVEAQPLPVVFQFTPYNRATRRPDRSTSAGAARAPCRD